MNKKKENNSWSGMNKKQENNYVNLMGIFDRDNFTAKFELVNDLAKFKVRNKKMCDIDCSACLFEFMNKGKSGVVKQ
mgnify:FL=1